MHCGELLTKGNKVEDRITYQTIGEYQSLAKRDNGVTIICEYGKLAISFYNPNLVRITLLNKKEMDLNTTPAVIKKNEPVQYLIEETAAELLLSRGAIKINFSKNDLLIKYYYQDHLITEDTSPHIWNYDTIQFGQKMRPDDKIYGLGEKTGFMDKRGRVYQMWNSDVYNPHNTSVDPIYISIPFFINFHKDRVYGLYFDNSYRSQFDMGEGGKSEYQISAQGGKLDYYMICGHDIKGIISGFTDLTGKTPLPSKWSLGHHQSKYSYRSEDEVLELAENFKKRAIPTDALHLDIHYMDHYKVFTWDENNFPRPGKMITKLKDEYHINVVTILDPGIKIEANYPVYREIMEKKLFCRYPNGREYIGEVWPGDTVFADFTKKEARKWWGQKTADFMTEYGVAGIWNDMNEPAVFNDTCTMDLEVYHDGDGDGGTHLRYHNLYALLQNMEAYECIKKTSRKRPFLLTRAGFAGIQRYTAVWTGDNRSMWEHVELSIPMILNLGLSGIANTGADIGGFAGNSHGELLTRWYQLGIFYPFFRNHCEIGALNQEPWAFGEKYEAIIRHSINLRYQLKSELYNAFYQSSLTGLPIMKPLVLEYPREDETHHLFDQFIFGNSLMVAPVCRPGVTKRIVYFPGQNWYHYYTGQKYQAQQSYICDTPLEQGLIFLKGGSIIAKNETGKHYLNSKSKLLTFLITLDENVTEYSYTNYDDDGESFEHENGCFYLEKISYQKTDREIVINQNIEKNQYETTAEQYQFILTNIPHQIKEVSCEQQKIKWSVSEKQLEITGPKFFNKIKITFVEN